MLDGLVLNKYSQNQQEVFVTSKGLFFDYFKSQQINSTQNLTSSQLSNVFTSLISDAQATVYFSEKISSIKNSQVYGCIGIFAQDIGPFPPDRIFVLISDEDYVYILQKKLDRPINEINECKAIYDSVNAYSQKYYDIYRASNRIEESAFNKAIELEETAWKSYHECYQNKFKSNKQYEDIQQQIERIVDYFVQKNSR